MPYQPVLGQIMPFAGSITPTGWAPCNGQLLAITTNQALFSLLGTYYGGDGIRTFGLPDLRGRAILGSNPSNVLGTLGGSVQVTLQVTQLPAHNHLIQASTTVGGGRGPASPANNLFGANTLPDPKNPTAIFLAPGAGETPLAQAANITNNGGNQPHNNMQPYLAINYLIALQGIYPSRT